MSKKSDNRENIKPDENEIKQSQLKREPVSDISDTEVIYPFRNEETLDGDKIFIECPGATVYEEGTKNVIGGAEFIDDGDPQKGYRIVGQPIFAPEHKSRRLVKKEHLNAIRRCQACQDLTVRLIRREGVDFFIPSPKHPRKTKLKSIEKNW